MGTRSPLPYHRNHKLKNNILQHCKNPGNAGNFTKELALNEASHMFCGRGIEYSGELPPSYGNCECAQGDDGCKEAIEEIRNEIEILENNSNVDPAVKSLLIANYLRCLDNLIRIEIQSAFDRGEVEETISYLSTQPEFRYQIMAYGIMNHDRDFDASRTYLNSLQTSTQDQIDFVATQNIYLDYITELDGFVVSSSDKVILEDAGKQENELAGYSRAIYYRLTGEKIEIDLPHLDGTITPRTSERVHSQNDYDDQSANVTIYPNPVDKDLIEITIKDFSPDKIYLLNIYDFYGRHITSKQLMSGHESMVMEEYPGTYFTTILADGHIVSNKKLIKL